MIYTTLLALVAIVFAVLAIQARRLLVSALWLAGVSAVISVVFYLLGGRQVAVIELSVGAGLVTVLFAFAISIAGEDLGKIKPAVPTVIPVALALLFFLLLAWFSIPTGALQPPQGEPGLADVIWGQRGMDVLVQVVLIFAGVLGLLGLLAETKGPLAYPVAKEYAAKRDRELEALMKEREEREKL